MNHLQVKRVKWKTLLLLLLCIGFVVLGAKILSLGIANWPNELFAFGLGLISVLFFGAAFLFGFKSLFSDRIELELTKSCLKIQPDTQKEITIQWDDITQFGVLNISGTKIILIYVRDPQNWIDRETNPIKRKLMQFNLSQYGSPFNFTSSGMNISHQNLLSQLISFHKEIGKLKNE